MQGQIDLRSIYREMTAVIAVTGVDAAAATHSETGSEMYTKTAKASESSPHFPMTQGTDPVQETMGGRNGLSMRKEASLSAALALRWDRTLSLDCTASMPTDEQ